MSVLGVILGLFTTKHFDDAGTSEHKNTYIMFRDLIDEYEGCDNIVPIHVYNLLFIADPNDVKLEEVRFSLLELWGYLLVDLIVGFHWVIITPLLIRVHWS